MFTMFFLVIFCSIAWNIKESRRIMTTLGALKKEMRESHDRIGKIASRNIK